MGTHARFLAWSSAALVLTLGITLALAAAPGHGLTIGTITTAAGSGKRGFSGDGGPATSAQLDYPQGVSRWGDGFLIADSRNCRIRRVSAAGVITTVAGTTACGFSGDGGQATQARLNSPTDVAPLPDGGFLIADNVNHRVRRVAPDGTITTVAGNGVATYGGDGGPATKASLRWPTYVAATRDGGFVVVDTTNRIRKVSADGVIRTVVGTGVAGFSGDGGPATAAKIYGSGGISPTSDDGFLFADPGNGRIRKVSADGVINTVAGSVGGMGDFGGDGGPATKGKLARPDDVDALAGGAFLIADNGNLRIRLVGTNGIITTVAGSGARGFSGDGGPAGKAAFDRPISVAQVPGGFVVSDFGSHRVRRVAANLGGKPPAGGPAMAAFRVRTYVNYVRGQFAISTSRMSGEDGISLKQDGTAAEKLLLTRQVMLAHDDLLRSGRPRPYSLGVRVVDGRYVTSEDTAVVPQLGYRVPGPWQALELRVQVTLAKPAGTCTRGTIGRLLLLDANTRLPGGRTNQTWDRVELLFPPACRTHSHGWTNADLDNAQPPEGGYPDGGQYALVSITPRLMPAAR